MSSSEIKPDAMSAVELLSPANATVVELNIGGQTFTTTIETLGRYENSLLGLVFSKLNNSSSVPLLRDTRGRFFIDRDGNLFRYILDYLRNDTLTLPEKFSETRRLIDEAKYYRLHGLVDELQTRQRILNKYETRAKDGLTTKLYQTSLNASDDELKPEETDSNMTAAGSTSGALSVGASGVSGGVGSPGFITVGYRGTFAFGRDGLADIQFRKVMRILVHGRVSLCREVFGHSLNESRDPDRGSVERYSSRFFLKYNSVEQAFDQLTKSGFQLRASCASSANGTSVASDTDNEETRWMHYTEFIFHRE